MLAAHDSVVAIDDPHIGHHLSVWRPISLAWATATELPRLQTLGAVKGGNDDYFFSDRYRDAWAPALREMILARFCAQAADGAGEGAGPMIAVKDPGASGVAELIGELFPGSRLVFLLRDGRDVVDSWLDAYRDGSWGVKEGTYPSRARAAWPSCAGRRASGSTAPRPSSALSGPTILHAAA